MLVVQELMTADPACCTRLTTLQEAAQKMVESDCGCLPVVENESNRRVVGVITDRDICCRGAGAGLDPKVETVSQCMTDTLVSVGLETSLEECFSLMEQHQLRRMIVVDEDNVCCGIVAQRDVAAALPPAEVGRLVQYISRPV